MLNVDLRLHTLSTNDLCKFRSMLYRELIDLQTGADGWCGENAKCDNCPYKNYCDYLTHAYVMVDCEIKSRPKPNK